MRLQRQDSLKATRDCAANLRSRILESHNECDCQQPIRSNDSRLCSHADGLHLQNESHSEGKSWRPVMAWRTRLKVPLMTVGSQAHRCCLLAVRINLFSAFVQELFRMCEPGQEQTALLGRKAMNFCSWSICC